MPLSKSNEACGVKNAATRKYLTADHCWYFPPSDVFSRLATFANQFGDPAGAPYFSVDGKSIISGSQWEQMRGKFHCEAATTNVWQCPALRGAERIKTATGEVAHPNQKPLFLTERIIRVSSDPGDVVWEPFGGLCTGLVACQKLGRDGYAAEIAEKTFEMAQARLCQLQ